MHIVLICYWMSMMSIQDHGLLHYHDAYPWQLVHDILFSLRVPECMAYLGCINLYTRGDKPKRFLSADFIRKNILYDSKQKYVKSGKG